MTTPSTELPTVYARDLETESEEHRWLIHQLWTRSAVGVLGGPPKVAKTFLALDLAVSVASGTPALGRFPVEAPGPALVYLAEDALTHVRDRLEALCQHRRLDINRLNVAIITAPVLRLDTTVDQDRLRATVFRFKPRLLVLDPLVRLHCCNENDAGEISRLLSFFRDIQRTFDVAVTLVHHMSKRYRSHPGQALRGSSDLHAWSDSSAYLTRRSDQILLTVEHRAAQPPEPMTLALVSQPDGSAIHLEICDAPSSPELHKPVLEHLVVDLLRHASPLSRQDIRAQLRVNNQRLGHVLARLEKRGQIHRSASGWQPTTPQLCEDLPYREEPADD
ncbi:MAG: AAA family ATPase [Armatimonadetes bacterium]|nr:AAA family ATPase [Armatimonadota bacterium]